MLFSLGHSTLSRSEFLQAARGIDVIVDVRSHPGSRHVPHFGKLEMESWLPEFGVAYEHWPQLGGWSARHFRMTTAMADHGVDVLAYSGKKFPKQRISARRPDIVLPAWENFGFYDYSWFMTIPEFLEGMDALIDKYAAPDQLRAAMVCAEAQWWRCHRSMLTDYLVLRGIPCYHLPTRPPSHEVKGRFQAHSEVIGDRLQRYDPIIHEVWRSWRPNIACGEPSGGSK